jgi:RecB family exonuclease
MGRDRITVTELDQWQDCHAKWFFKYFHRYTPTKGESMGNRAYGTLAHKGAEVRLLLGRDDYEPAVRLLADRIGADEKAIQSALGAVRGIPQWVWKLQRPQVETEIELHVPNEEGVPGADNITLVGHPDVWGFTGENEILVIDFKTTSESPKARLNKIYAYEVQLKRYASMLYTLMQQGHFGPPIQNPIVGYQYIVVNYKGYHEVGGLNFLNQKIVDHVLGQAFSIARQIGWDQEGENYGPLCGWCEYWPICEAGLTGGNQDDIIDTDFVVKEAVHV